MVQIEEPKLEIRAMFAPWYAGIEILIVSPPKYPGDKRSVVKDIILEEVDDRAIIDPTLRLDMMNAQMLMDDLWQCGIRPTNEVDSPGELKATKYHLEDMKKLVFDKGIK